MTCRERATMRLAASVVALLLVGAVTACSPPDDKTEASAPVTVTATTTAVETTTVNETTTEVPQSCLDALDDADDLVQISASFATIVSKYPGMMLRAVNAAVAYDAVGINEVTAQMKQMTGKIKALNVRTRVNTYAQNRDKCRQEAE